MIVVDLDGTYCSCNTLHLYLLTAFTTHLRSGHLPRAWRIVYQYLKRGLRLSSHLKFKEASLSAAGQDAYILQSFKRKAVGRINEKLKKQLNSLSSGETIVMATAAPEFYARLIWPGKLLASTIADDGKIEELRGTAKLQAVRQLQQQLGDPAISAVYTDHHDDLPLIKAAERCILVHPSKRTEDVLRGSGIVFTLFK